MVVELSRLSTEADSEIARVAAIKELLDLAYGEAPSGEDGEPIKIVMLPGDERA
jgi:hypothetical protein